MMYLPEQAHLEVYFLDRTFKVFLQNHILYRYFLFFFFKLSVLKMAFCITLCFKSGIMTNGIKCGIPNICCIVIFKLID